MDWKATIDEAMQLETEDIIAAHRKYEEELILLFLKHKNKLKFQGCECNGSTIWSADCLFANCCTKNEG